MPEQFNFGEAIVEIISDPSRLTAGFRKAEQEGQNFSARMGGIMKEVAAVAIPAGIAATIVGLIQHTTKEVGELRVLSQQLGITTEQLSALQFATIKSGGEVDALNVGLRMLSRQLVKGEDDLGRQSKGLLHLGVAARDSNGELRGTFDVLLDIADKFSKARDNAEKTAMAVELFGRSGSRMIPLLNLGRDGIRELTKQAERMGYIVSAEAAEAAHKFEINLAMLKAQFTGTSRTILSELMPAMLTLTTMLSDVGTETEKSRGVISDWTDYLLKPKVVLTEVSLGIREVLYGLQALIKTIMFLDAHALDWHNLFKMPAQQRAEVVAGLKAILDDYQRQLREAGDIAAEALSGPIKALSDAMADTLQSDTISKANRSLEVSIIQKKLEIAATRDQMKTAEMYAEALDKVAYQTAIDGGASETLAKILMDLNKVAREAIRLKDQQKVQFERETKLIHAQYQLAVKLANERFQGEKTLYDFMRDSRLRAAELSMNSYQREVAEARHAYDQQIEMLGEREMSQEQYNQAIIQAQNELMDTLEVINRKYNVSEITMLQQRIAAHKSAALQVLEIESQVLDDLRTALGQGFFDLMSGKFHDLDDVVKQFFTSFKRHISDFLADLVMKQLEKWLLRLALAFASRYGIGATTTAPAAGAGYGGPFGTGGVVRAAASGMIVQGPTMLLAGERGVDEAVIPMPSGKVRAEVVDRHRTEPFQINQAIRVVIAPETFAAMRTSPDEVIIYAAQNIRAGGVLYNTINGMRRS